jgi:sporulation integral membrane protein YtvI
MLSHIKKEAAIAAIGYLRSYSLILLITFAEIFFGLSILGVEYSLLVAAITAIVDILPVLGVGVILLPWALFALITKDIFLGVGLLILYVVTVVVRQFIEPRIVGENLGLHPLLTLAAFYLGYRLFGFAGILIAPLTLVAWRAIRTYSRNAAISDS